VVSNTFNYHCNCPILCIKSTKLGRAQHSPIYCNVRDFQTECLRFWRNIFSLIFSAIPYFIAYFCTQCLDQSSQFVILAPRRLSAIRRTETSVTNRSSERSWASRLDRKFSLIIRHVVIALNLVMFWHRFGTRRSRLELICVWLVLFSILTN
jgi:hypothetical protein